MIRKKHSLRRVLWFKRKVEARRLELLTFRV